MAPAVPLWSMGQVLGFSHCKEYGSVSSTPDSTPPCTDGGNEESELYDLQTAREWSDQDDGGPEDDDGAASSPSIWGTPRQNSFELTFSYIAIAEAEVGGVSRHHRDPLTGSRRRVGARAGRSLLSRTDTAETLLPLDSPDEEWETHALLGPDEEERNLGRQTQMGRDQDEEEVHTLTESVQAREEENREREERVEREIHRPAEIVLPFITETETQERTTGPMGREEESLEPRLGSPSASQQGSMPAKLESPVTMETPVKLLTAVLPSGSLTDDVSPLSPSSISPSTQEELASKQWSSAVDPSEGPTICTHITVMDLIYWKDVERTGIVFTGLVVGLLSLFQLSIITVISTVCLAVMCFTVSVSLYYRFLHLLNMGDGVHPFQSYLDLDISFSGEQAENYMQKAIVTVISAADSLKNLFLVANLLDSLKLLALMYLVTYLGALCNGLTVFIIGVITLFSVPLFYKQHQEKVDSFFAGIQAKIDNVKDTLQRIAQGGGPPPDHTPGGAKPKTQ
ncbi:reticulon-2a isoform X1 [Esox lucius]|uniref:reticulon-2a isoform X1 n=1 Tax=Esox lucius TaxID=8010 RepID=UPI0014774550|nr:reticulon-2a isoform X1 [Esox lucius]